MVKTGKIIEVDEKERGKAVGLERNINVGPNGRAQRSALKRGRQSRSRINRELKA